MRADDNYEHDDGPSPAADDLLLQRFLDDELRAHERRDLETRLAGDSALAARLERLRRTCEVLAAGQPDPAPLTPGFGDRLWQSFERQSWPELADEAAVRPPQTWSEAGALLALKRWSLAAAAAVLLLSGLLVLWRPAAPGALQADPRVHEVLRELDRKAQQADPHETGKRAEREAEQRRRRGKKPAAAADGR